jgi:hypothetical protein
MRKLAEVEDARALMTEAMSWSVLKWLREKRRVRKVADKANAALDARNEEVKAAWSEDLKAAYRELLTPGAKAGRREEEEQAGRRDLRLYVKRVKEADEEAYRARMAAEAIFDEAERELSTSLAREGCRKAILSWELHEKAIRKAEAGVPGRV